MKGKYIIIDPHTMEYMRDEHDNLCIYSTFEEAIVTCGMYEFEDVWICQLTHNYKEK